MRSNRAGLPQVDISNLGVGKLLLTFEQRDEFVVVSSTYFFDNPSNLWQIIKHLANCSKNRIIYNAMGLQKIFCGHDKF